jgi:O-methyltransferase involved in polyketide biosynthesis
LQENPVSDVSATSFLTLYCHAADARSEEPILNDTRSLEIASFLDTLLVSSGDPLARSLVAGRLKGSLVTHIAMRAKRYDDYVRDFLSRFPEGVVVNIGCGLDSRFQRIDNGAVHFYDLDLPEVVSLRQRFFEDTGRYRQIAISVLDYEWMDNVSVHRGPFLFLAEGVLMYLQPGEVKSLVLELERRFPGSELVCEVVNARWLEGPLRKIVEFKMRHELHIGKEASYHFGLGHTREMEEWNPGIVFLDDWSYLDSYDKTLGWLRIFCNIRWIRYTQWTVHYRLT